MATTLSEDLEESLEQSRKVFNRLTGKRFNTEQFLKHVIQETAETAKLARPYVYVPVAAARKARNVH